MYSRRDFGKIVVAGLPLSLALADINPKVNGVRIGVQSYSFRSLSLDDAIKAMVDIGIGECELFSGHVEPRPQFGPGGPGGGRPPQGAPPAGSPPAGSPPAGGAPQGPPPQ
ncbi:MAG: sugar phosphate isomerase/epimerase family protein, partial [Blastocatellia bacterium]